MEKMKFGSDKEMLDLASKVSACLSYLQLLDAPEHVTTVRTLLTDNIKLFNRVKELENGNTSSEN